MVASREGFLKVLFGNYGWQLAEGVVYSFLEEVMHSWPVWLVAEE